MGDSKKRITNDRSNDTAIATDHDWKIAAKVGLALYESLKPVQRKRGRPCSTWIKIIEKDLSLVDIKLNLNKTTPDETIATLEGLAEDRRKWRSLVKDIKAVNR